MRYSLVVLATLALCLLSGAQEAPDETIPAVVENVTGTVTRVGDFGYGLVPDSDPGTRYAPTEPLAVEFREHGLRVRFSGVEGDPSDVRGRRWGTPFEVTHIERLESP